MADRSPRAAAPAPLRMWIGFVTLGFVALFAVPGRQGPRFALAAVGRIHVVQSPVVLVRGHGDVSRPLRGGVADGAIAPTAVSLAPPRPAAALSPAPPRPAASPAAAVPDPPAGGALGAAGPPEGTPRYSVVLDPGHGGQPESADRKGGAHWDPMARRFWNPYRFGCAHRQGRKVLTEHAVVLDLARRTRALLALTASDAGWERFCKILARHGAPLAGPTWPRLVLDVRLSREHSYETHPRRREGNVNRFFRLFDSPESFPATVETPIHPGRISRIAAWAPHLVVCLHINGARNTRLRGMNALFVPDHAVFEEARQVVTGKKKRMSHRARMVKRFWRFADASRTKRGWMFNDTWTYFTGCGSEPNGLVQDPSVNVSMRWNQVTWAYRDPVMPAVPTTLDRAFEGPFWTRERSPQEAFRRAGGAEGLGGDNLLAGQELLRFVRQALWKDYEDRGVSFAKGELGPGAYLGPHHAPTAADWAMCLFCNAVVAYLELGYLSNPADRWLLTERRDRFAEGLAVGIYSLFAGLRPATGREGPVPRGTAIDWKRYVVDGRSHFAAARVRPASKAERRPR